MRCILCADVDLTKAQRKQTCVVCEQRTRSTLRRVMDAAALLPAVLPGGAAAGNDRVSGSHDLPMPGGNALVILGPGRDVPGYPDTERPDDPVPLVNLLGTWEDDWREQQHQPPRPFFGSIGATVSAAYHYLVAHNFWAAEAHPAYDEYASDLTGMLKTMERLLSTNGYIERLPIPCPDCGGTFVRPNGASHIRCVDCRRIWPDEDYRRLSIIVIADFQQASA